MDLLEIKKLFKNKNNYVSFRDLENVSLINKKNTFNTPTGIYTYPCISFYEKVSKVKTVDELISIFPYHGRNKPKYLYIYTIKSNSKYLDSNSTFDKILPYYKNIINLKVPIYQENIINNLKKYLKKEQEPKEGFYSLKSYQMFKSYDIRDDDSTNEIEKFWTLTWHLQEEEPNKWSNLLRKIGLDYLVDYGIGYIHTNEPTQAVILNTNCIEDLKTFNLIDYSVMNYTKAKDFCVSTSHA